MKGPAVITCLDLICRVADANTEKITYTGNQLWKIANDNKTTPKLLHALQNRNYLSIWGKTSATIDAMINAKYLNKVNEKLAKNNITYEVSIEDIQKAIELENPQFKDDDLEYRNLHFTFLRYYRLENIHQHLRLLQTIYPNLCIVRTIGHSIEGRPIRLLKISNKNPNNVAIFIEGGIHSREWVSPAAVMYIITHFLYNHDREPYFVRNIDWYFVPVLNPDGYEYTHTVDRLWRKNRARFGKCVGVDLNRNWDYDWGENGSSENPCSNSYKGPKPFSEPETRVVKNFFLKNKNIKWRGYISVHSYGQYLVYPWGSPTSILEDGQELDRIAKEAATAIRKAGGSSYTVGPTGTTIYSASGIASDWARASQKIKYAYTIELKDTGRYGFLLPANLIGPTVKEALIFVTTVAKAAAGA